MLGSNQLFSRYLVVYNSKFVPKGGFVQEQNRPRFCLNSRLRVCGKKALQGAKTRDAQFVPGLLFTICNVGPSPLHQFY
jgi:hypothetical protein